MRTGTLSAIGTAALTATVGLLIFQVYSLRSDVRELRANQTEMAQTIVSGVGKITRVMETRE